MIMHILSYNICDFGEVFVFHYKVIQDSQTIVSFGTLCMLLMSSLDQATKLSMPLPQMMMILMKMMSKSLLYLKKATILS